MAFNKAWRLLASLVVQTHAVAVPHSKPDVHIYSIPETITERYFLINTKQPHIYFSNNLHPNDNLDITGVIKSHNFIYLNFTNYPV